MNTCRRQHGQALTIRMGGISISRAMKLKSPHRVLALGSCLILVTTIVLGQTARRKTTKAKTPRGTDKSFTTRCGVYYPDIKHFMSDIDLDYFEVSSAADTKFYYRPKDTSCDDRGILRIWIKEVPKLPKFGDDQESYTLVRYEIKCREEQLNTLSRIVYNSKGNVVRSRSFDPDFTDVVPDSVGSAIVREACRPS